MAKKNSRKDRKKDKKSRRKETKSAKEIKDIKEEVQEVKEVKSVVKTEVTYKQDAVKTLFPLGLGAVAGIISYLINLEAHRDPLGIIVLVIFIYLHKFILPKFEIEPAGKDWAVITFLSFTAWYIAWTFLLNA